jgi:hypothetical protein
MHHELPERLDLEWYRKRAKALVREYRAGDPDAAARVGEALGDRDRFGLSDAQHLLARRARLPAVGGLQGVGRDA